MTEKRKLYPGKLSPPPEVTKRMLKNFNHRGYASKENEMSNDYCYSCDSCNSCNYCDYCNSCDSCKNIRMTEYNRFCYSEKYNDENSFQQERYRVFNRVVGESRYYEIKDKVKEILGTPKTKLTDFWKQVTQDQWKQLLEIPEAKDFKNGFEYISGQKIEIDSKVEISCEGKVVKLSRESAKALGLI